MYTYKHTHTRARARARSLARPHACHIWRGNLTPFTIRRACSLKSLTHSPLPPASTGVTCSGLLQVGITHVVGLMIIVGVVALGGLGIGYFEIIVRILSKCRCACFKKKEPPEAPREEKVVSASCPTLGLLPGAHMRACPVSVRFRNSPKPLTLNPPLMQSPLMLLPWTNAFGTESIAVCEPRAASATDDL
jgi:hypothetical protein